MGTGAAWVEGRWYRLSGYVSNLTMAALAVVTA